jgi:hypothetical protein
MAIHPIQIIHRNNSPDIHHSVQSPSIHPDMVVECASRKISINSNAEFTCHQHNPEGMKMQAINPLRDLGRYVIRGHVQQSVASSRGNRMRGMIPSTNADGATPVQLNRVRHIKAASTVSIC